MYSKVLLKLSGEAIAAENFPFSSEVLNNVAKQIKTITEMGVKVGVVIGGGNICRGREFEKLGFDRVKADYTGMLATVINSTMLEQTLIMNGCKAKAMSVVKAQNVMDYDIETANKLLDDGYVLIFGGGYGLPGYSTDSGSAQRAAEIHADAILMAKMGVDGVYTADPNKDPNAQRINNLSFQEILDDKLAVIDLEAAQMCIDNKIEAFVFNMLDEDNIVKAVKGEAIGTTIKY